MHEYMFGCGPCVCARHACEQEGAIQSAEIVVQAGQKIFGNMTLTAPNTWYCGSYVDSPQGQCTSFTQVRALSVRALAFVSRMDT